MITTQLVVAALAMWDEISLWSWRRWRRVLIWVSYRVPERLERRIVDWLYPDDLMVAFPSGRPSPEDYQDERG